MASVMAVACRTGVLSFILITYFTVTSSMTLDLTELRNKVSKIKMNPRGNLWATGHFMGKKSIVDSSIMDPAYRDLDNPIQTNGEDMREHIIQELKIVLQGQQKRDLERKRDPA
ncbi:unnamed protein product [Arctogadus glacialis]